MCLSGPAGNGSIVKAPPAELGGNLHNVVLVEKSSYTFVYYCASGININLHTHTHTNPKNLSYSSLLIINNLSVLPVGALFVISFVSIFTNDFFF